MLNKKRIAKINKKKKNFFFNKNNISYLSSMITLNETNFFPRFFDKTKNNVNINNFENQKILNIFFKDKQNFQKFRDLEQNEETKLKYFISSQSFLIKNNSLVKLSFEKKNNYLEIFPISEKKLDLKINMKKLNLKIKVNILDNYLFFLINRKTEQITIVFSSDKEKVLSEFFKEIFSELLEKTEFLNFRLKFDYLKNLEKDYFFYSCIKFDFEDFKYDIINSLIFENKNLFEIKKKNYLNFSDNEFENVKFTKLRYLTFQDSFINKYKSPGFFKKRNKILNLKEPEENLISEIKFQNPEFFIEKFLRHLNKKLMIN